MPTINKPKQGGKKPRQYVKGSYIEPRYNTQHWRNLRASVLQASPLCKACESVGLITLAQMVDHIEPVRLGVLDVGSNTIHLQVMDAHPGARPTPATNYKVELRLTEYLDSTGAISPEGIILLHKAIGESVAHASENETDEILAFATSAIRDATNGTKIIAEISEKHGIELEILDGDSEATMTFLAVRRWLGWSAGKLLVLDIGGGSLEIASGVNENPEATISLPLGAARLTRDFLHGDPYSSKSLKVCRDGFFLSK